MSQEATTVIDPAADVTVKLIEGCFLGAKTVLIVIGSMLLYYLAFGPDQLKYILAMLF